MAKEKKYSTLSAQEKSPVLQNWLTEHKARDLAVIQLPEGNPLADIVIIVSASSARHARSLADGLSELCKQQNFEALRTEGYQEGQWVLVDLNDIIIHIFQEPVRELYHLESLWNNVEALSAARPADNN
jgi:ribosome-associated protein